MGWLILLVLTLEERGDRGCTELPKEQDEERPQHTEGSSQGPGLVICFKKFSYKWQKQLCLLGDTGTILALWKYAGHLSSCRLTPSLLLILGGPPWGLEY